MHRQTKQNMNINQQAAFAKRICIYTYTHTRNTKNHTICPRSPYFIHLCTCLTRVLFNKLIARCFR